MRRMLMAAVVAAALGWPATAGAAVPSVFGGALTCAVQACGQRFCDGTATTIPSWDGTPIDVSVAFPPAPADGQRRPLAADRHLPRLGRQQDHPSSADAQRWLTNGYAVFTMTDRGWGSSCGGPSEPANTSSRRPANAATST